jgi:hypothetical protein
LYGANFVAGFLGNGLTKSLLTLPSSASHCEATWLRILGDLIPTIFFKSRRKFGPLRPLRWKCEKQLHRDRLTLGPAPIDTQACQQQVDSSTTQESHVQVCHAQCDPQCCSGAHEFFAHLPAANSMCRFLLCFEFPSVLPVPPHAAMDGFASRQLGDHDVRLLLYLLCIALPWARSWLCLCLTRCEQCAVYLMSADSGTTSSRGCTGLARRHTRVLTVDGVPDAALPPGVVPVPLLPGNVPGALPAVTAISGRTATQVPTMRVVLLRLRQRLRPT